MVHWRAVQNVAIEGIKGRARGMGSMSGEVRSIDGLTVKLYYQNRGPIQIKNEK